MADSSPQAAPAPDPACSRPIAALVAQARAVLAEAESARDWSAADRERALAALDRTSDLVAAARGRVLRAERDAGTWARRGDRDLVGWRGRTSRAGLAGAAAQVREAETLEAMPEVERALADGRVREAHVGVLARAAARAPGEVVEVMRSAEGQAELVAMADRTDQRRYAAKVDRWLAELDPAGRQRTHDEQREARFLHLSHSPAGTHLKGLIDTESGHVLQLALEAAQGGPPAPDDERSGEQRSADNLVTLAEHLLADEDVVPGAKVRPHVSVILQEDTWVALARARRDAADQEDPRPLPRALAAMTGAPAPTDEDGRAMPITEVLRILCDCDLTRVVVDAEGVPVDLGRTARLHSTAQRRAIAHRDGGCTWPGCTFPARWSEVHHIRWWFRDLGATSVDDGVLLCSFHHHLVHRRDISITRLPRSVASSPTAPGAARYVFARPDGSVVDEVDPGSEGPELRDTG